MLVDFNSIRKESKLIIFSSDKEIVQNAFVNDLELFIKYWTSHGKVVIGSFKIFFKHIVIIAIDESEYSLSGCSKDKCYNFFKKCKKSYNLNFFRRDLVYYLNDNDFVINTIDDFKKLPIKERLNFNMLNIMLTYKKDIDLNFKQKYKDSFWSKICH